MDMTDKEPLKKFGQELELFRSNMDITK